MNSSEHFILLLIAILTCFVFNSYKNFNEQFAYDTTYDSSYAPIGTFGINNHQKPIPINKYANQIAYDLENPFPNSKTGGNNRVPWNPASYREVQEPDGNFVGIFSSN
jgi:hypothetical protein